MAGAKKGGRKTAQTMIEKYGKDYYARIGAMGGKASIKGGFHHMRQHNPSRFREISSLGGKNSRRAK